MKSSGNENINQQIKYYAQVFIKQYEEEFPKLDYSFESLEIIDQIIRSKTQENLNTKEIIFYFLETLRKNLSIEIIWDKFTQEPIIIFNNFSELFLQQYIEKQIESNGKYNSLKIVKNLMEKDN